MNELVRVYDDMKDDLRENLTKALNYNLLCGNKEEAYGIFLKLMDYKLLDKESDILANYKVIFGGKDGVDTRGKNFGRFDYRGPNGTAFIPKYVYCELRDYDTMNIDSIEHVGRRVEGVYEGDTLVKGSDYRLRIAHCRGSMDPRNATDKASAIFAKYNINVNLDDLKRRITLGETRCYSITYLNSVLSKYSTVGYLFMHMNDDMEMQVDAVIDWEAVYGVWIDINEFVKKLTSVANNLLYGKYTVELNFATPVEDAKKAQSDIIRSNNERRGSAK